MKIRLGTIEIGLARYLALWLPVTFVFIVQGIIDDLASGHLWALTDYVRWSVIVWYIWAALAPWVFRLAERHPVQPPYRAGPLLFHLFAASGLTFLSMVAGAFISTFFEPSSFGEQLAQFFTKYITIGVVTYCALVAIQHSLRFQAEKARRELEASQLATELAQSRLQVLKTQLQPHFLFNTLHAIVTLLDEDKVSAEDMLLRLSDLLRAFLEDYDGQEITLRRELALLDLYLGIQRKRYGDRLATQIYIAPDLLDCAVPSLLLQPIVENAIRHGIGQRVGGDRIEIEARREGDHLLLEVRNGNSVLEEGGSPGGHGIGLSNTRLRLRELYGEGADLRLDMTWPQGVACRIRLPYRLLEELDDVPEHVPA
jgi:two-component system LytT family sensor kinase